jgi:hypothetical protein
MLFLAFNPTNEVLDDFKQKVSAFASDQADAYDKKYLNIADRNLGAIDEIDCAWKSEFLLKSKEKEENNIGNRSYAKYYFSFYAYETLEDRKYALKDWMADFIEGESIRAGRMMRSYEYATPTIILIQDLNIVICNYKCSDYNEDTFKAWKKKLLKYFGEDDTRVIELQCDGPLEWTKNPPDSKNRREMI